MKHTLGRLCVALLAATLLLSLLSAGAPLLQGKVRAELYAMALGANGLALCMELTNDTDRAVRLQLQKATVAGKIVDYKYYSKDFFLPAHTALDDVIKVTTKYDLEAGEAFHDLTIGFSWDEGAATAAISGFDGLCGSTEGVLLTPDELTIQPARICNE